MDLRVCVKNKPLDENKWFINELVCLSVTLACLAGLTVADLT